MQSELVALFHEREQAKIRKDCVVTRVNNPLGPDDPHRRNVKPNRPHNNNNNSNTSNRTLSNYAGDKSGALSRNVEIVGGVAVAMSKGKMSLRDPQKPLALSPEQYAPVKRRCVKRLRRFVTFETDTKLCSKDAAAGWPFLHDNNRDNCVIFRSDSRGWDPARW